MNTFCKSLIILVGFFILYNMTAINDAHASKKNMFNYVMKHIRDNTGIVIIDTDSGGAIADKAPELPKKCAAGLNIYDSFKDGSIGGGPYMDTQTWCDDEGSSCSRDCFGSCDGGGGPIVGSLECTETCDSSKKCESSSPTNTETTIKPAE